MPLHATPTIVASAPPAPLADAATGPQRSAERACALGVDPDTCALAELLDRGRALRCRRTHGGSGLADPGQDRAGQLFFHIEDFAKALICRRALAAIPVPTGSQ